MVWKQDLAKLKQKLGEEPPTAPPPKPQPKTTPKPSETKDLNEEDAVFLAAMGKRPAPPARRAAPAEGVSPEPPSPPPAPETFASALEDLKGLKPLAGPPVLSAPAPRKAPVQKEAAPEPQPPPPLPPVPPSPEPPAAVSPALPEAPAQPQRFQLAAGMAIEVDGVLDLRGHCKSDAVERLKDRLGDGQVLGWRTLQVILGPAPELHEALLELLEAGQVPMVSRYAQAPVPMGGNQAWLLYFGPPAP